MEEIDPDILELLKRDAPPDQECKLVKRSEWSYAYMSGKKTHALVSRFLAEKNFEVSASKIRQQWAKWNQRERIDFASNWGAKRGWNHDDTKILELIMADGDDYTWGCCTRAFLRYPNRDRAISFLINRLSNYTLSREPLNYIQALGLLRDKRAADAIRPFFERYQKELKTEELTGVPDDVFFGPIPYFPYLVAAGALFKISGLSEYETAIRGYFDHPNEQVRYWAEHELEVEGPTTAKRKTENGNR